MNDNIRNEVKTFKIKISTSGKSTYGRLRKFVGVRGLLQFVGLEMANDILAKAFESKEDKYERKLRRGLKITFYYYFYKIYN